MEAKIDRILHDICDGVASDVERNAIRNASGISFNPFNIADAVTTLYRRTGNLAASIHKEEVQRIGTKYRSIVGIIRSMAKYAEHVEYGTGLWGKYKKRIGRDYPRPEHIGPYKKAMVFRKPSGEVVIVRSIAGMRPRPFMRSAYFQTKQKSNLIEIVKAVLQKHIR